ncbi:unnamed protein product [Protopolystoma xenopodis]|uniref:Uncharacterized protein n=1 Tax=Protopolystoma xenopodis TaxID=117903 RepID=A0A3S5AZI1_9PLAT|nr:unnamed protein product [Protopolystoma xenopodis]
MCPRPVVTETTLDARLRHLPPRLSVPLARHSGPHSFLSPIPIHLCQPNLPGGVLTLDDWALWLLHLIR